MKPKLGINVITKPINEDKISATRPLSTGSPHGPRLLITNSRNALTMRCRPSGNPPAGTVLCYSPHHVATAVRNFINTPRISRPRLLDRTSHHALDEVTLECEEDDQRHNHRQENAGSDDVDARPELPRLLLQRHRDRLGVLSEHQRHQQVVPHPEELEDRQRRDRGPAERQHHLAEDGELLAAVHPGRLQQVPWDPDEEVAQQENPERQPEGDVEQHRGGHRTEDADSAEQLRVRDHADLDRHHDQRHHQDEQPVAAGELHPREGVRRSSGDQHHQQGRRHRDQDGVHQRLDHGARLQQVGVVVEAQLIELVENGPPARAGCVLAGAEARDEDADGGHQPEQPHQHQADLHHSVAQQADHLVGDPAPRSPQPGRLQLRARIQCGAHDCSLRNRRTLNSIAGSTTRNSRIANALPMPWFCAPPKDAMYISYAMTVALSGFGGITYTRSKIFSTLIISVTKTTTSTGRTSGMVTRRNTCHSVAPSTRAASRASRGIAARPAAISTIAKPAQIQMYAPMIDGVTSVGPSQLIPLYLAAKLAAGSRIV